MQSGRIFIKKLAVTTLVLVILIEILWGCASTTFSRYSPQD